MAKLPKYDLLEVPWTDVAAWIKAGNDVVFDANELGKFVPVSLFPSPVVSRASPFEGNSDRVVTKAVPTDRHGC